MADETCMDEAARDLIPLFAHDALEGREAAGVRAHLEGCAACRMELAVVRSASAALSAAAPRVSTAAIVAGVQRATRLRVERGTRSDAPSVRRGSRWMPRRYAAAAASFILVASASLAVLARTFGDPDAASIDAARGATVDTAMGGVGNGRAMASAAAGISVTGGLSDLSDDELARLLDELDRVEATVAAEPALLRRALVDDQEQF